MKKSTFVIIAVSLIILIVGTIFLVYEPRTNEPRICFEETCFDIEIVDEEQERNKGLMFREELANDVGMFFIFEQSGNYPFWMKNTPLPLDIIWIDSELKVVHIANYTAPQSTDIIDPLAVAKYVLEINGGLSETLGIEIGSVAVIRGIDG